MSLGAATPRQYNSPLPPSSHPAGKKQARNFGLFQRDVGAQNLTEGLPEINFNTSRLIVVIPRTGSLSVVLYLFFLLSLLSRPERGLSYCFTATESNHD